MSMLWDSSPVSIAFMSEPLTRMSFGPSRITLLASKHLPPQTGYLLSSVAFYELVCDGDGLRIARQFRWPTLQAKSRFSSILSSSPG
jgi:hypothetical protein